MNIISPLIEELMHKGVQLSDKSKQALSVAGYEAKDRQYRFVYDDNILNGLVKTNTVCTGLFESFGIEPSEILTDVYLPLAKNLEYRQPYGKVGEDRLKRFEKQGMRQGSTVPHSYSNQHNLLDGLSGHVTTSDLLLMTLSKPAAYSAMKRQGVSINKVKMYIKSINTLEPDIENQKIVLGLKNNKITVDSFDYSIAAKLPSSNALTPSIRSNIIVTENRGLLKK